MSDPKDSDFETSSKDSCFFEESSSSTVMTNPPGDEKPLITKEMEAEEKKMTEENQKEEERIKKQYKEELETQEKLEKEAKYKRLMHLLNQSQFYTNFLMRKIEASKIEEAKREEAKKRAEEKKNNLESRSLKEVNVVDNSSPKNQPKKDHGTRNPRKRSKITDYIDHETINNVKKRRTDSDEILKKPEPTPLSGVCINSMGLEVSENQPVLFEGGVLRDYQLQGLEWMKALFENGVNGILADEMGLGKTIQVIALLCHLIENGIPGPYLIVAPLSTLPNWVMEFERFAPQLPVILFHGSKYERPKMYKKLRTKVRINEKVTIAPVVLTSYQVPLKETKFMSTFNWRYIIVDEGHALKNANTQLSRCLKSFKSVNRILLTGTPLQNNLKELWALLNFLLPEVFDGLTMFQALFDIEAVTSHETGSSILQKEAESHILTTLHQILTPFLLRRVKADVELNLPTKKEVLVYCPMTDLQLKLYKATIDKVIETLLKSDKEEDVPIDLDGPRRKRKCAEQKKDYTFKDFDWFGENTPPEEEEEPQEILVEPGFHNNIKMVNPEMQLRKIANHPYLVQMPVEVVDGERVMKSSEEVVSVSGKMLALNAMLLKLKQRGHKVLIFSFFKIMLNLIEEFALMRDYRYVRLDGSDNIEDRKKNIKAFNSDPNIFLFLITTRAGGLGLNLTSADTVIIFDSDYNPQVDLQAMDRCHRIGQKKPVIVYRFISRGTVDEKIHKVACGKRKLEKVVIKKGAFKLSGPAKKAINDLEELQQLLESADHHKEVQSNGLVFTDEELEELLDRTVDNGENEGNHFKVLAAGASQ
ncbi:lymphocyte-specific helicase-like [Macrosteles quadrilineatus]|uniref:lymphocyte-specific helicase-like n=1 Tax=Macrosteles quadrilineatus TaxID=74068 RepID=UPI0023E25F55|nr:lymphocyte-specific helicase-like [Macrosteles quadrilineatus]